ncbi:hypothetical protein ATY41_00765 [Leifsonia xyli subsp. xyli]|uniref:Uncharacterized protein n=1 Tax=Leifsonia xyli subsp. xyli TaxID=59736 RepID=A0A1E2SN55_LEIXY|nr:hypothetical protein [Leifsonia xyli]ODA91262.1 hypothetical protein ATY41_00765 [Leifsonia xyli subsp. xyli]
MTAPACYSAALDARLAAQVTAWTTVQKATESDDAASALGRLRASLTAVQNALATAQSTDAKQQEKLRAALDLADAQARAARTDADTLHGDLLAVSQQQDTLAAAIAQAFQDAADDTNSRVAETVSEQTRVVSEQGRLSREALTDSYDRTIAGLTSTSGRVLDESGRMIDQQKRKLAETDAKATAALSERTARALDGIARSTTASALDVVSATALLQGRLQGVLLDLGDRSPGGAGLLGAMSASAAKSDTADFQLALASQNAAGYANIRAEDIAGILLGQAQFSAALDEAAAYPPFHLTVPSGASWQTIYSFQIGGGRK